MSRREQMRGRIDRSIVLRLDAVSGSVIGRIDALGGVILVGYVLFALFRGDLLDLWFDGRVVGVASLAALAG